MTTHPIRAAFDADDEFSRLLREEFGDAAGDMRYRPSRWTQTLRDQWSKTQEKWKAALSVLRGTDKDQGPCDTTTSN